MRPINVAIVLITLITAAHAVEQKATEQTDTASIVEPPLPRPKPSPHDVAGDNPAMLISAFCHQHGEESVSISPVLTRMAQEQANAMAARDSLDHNALAPFSSRIGLSGFSRAAENIAYGHANFAGTLEQLTDELVERCCIGYWGCGPATNDDCLGVFVSLRPSFIKFQRIFRRLSHLVLLHRLLKLLPIDYERCCIDRGHFLELT